MGWVLAAALALAALALLVLALQTPRAGWEAIGAALLLGLVGYAWQGSPKLAGSPGAPAERVEGDPASLIAARRALAGGATLGGDSRMMIADALARHGQFADAATVLQGAVDRDPRNAEAWTALGNALVGHAEGSLGPAALYAYRRGALADPAAPAPPYFLGLALAENGRFDEARASWAKLLAATPPQAPLRADLTDKLQRLDFLIAMRGQAPARRSGAP